MAANVVLHSVINLLLHVACYGLFLAQVRCSSPSNFLRARSICSANSEANKRRCKCLRPQLRFHHCLVGMSSQDGRGSGCSQQKSLILSVKYQEQNAV